MKYIEAWGESKSIVDWVKDPRCVVGYSTLWARISRGMDVLTALTRPRQIQTATRAERLDRLEEIVNEIRKMMELANHYKGDI